MNPRWANLGPDTNSSASLGLACGKSSRGEAPESYRDVVPTKTIGFSWVFQIYVKVYFTCMFLFMFFVLFLCKGTALWIKNHP
jgi:hypothetical protein